MIDYLANEAISNEILQGIGESAQINLLFCNQLFSFCLSSWQCDTLNMLPIYIKTLIIYSKFILHLKCDDSSLAIINLRVD